MKPSIDCTCGVPDCVDPRHRPSADGTSVTAPGEVEATAIAERFGTGRPAILGSSTFPRPAELKPEDRSAEAPAERCGYCGTPLVGVCDPRREVVDGRRHTDRQCIEYPKAAHRGAEREVARLTAQLADVIVKADSWAYAAPRAHWYAWGTCRVNP
jgi:hypothetical protein